MIDSYKTYKEYLQQDLISTGIIRGGVAQRLKDRRFRFYKSLRLAEYFTNCYPNGLMNIVGKIVRLRHHFLCEKYNWTIPVNVFDKGLAIVHTGTIVVNGSTQIGENCRLHVCVNIGSAWKRGGIEEGAPKIGNNVYIGPGAKIFGPIIIGDNTVIGANAVVNDSFPEGNCTIAGVPAKKISDNTSEKYILNMEKK